MTKVRCPYVDCLSYALGFCQEDELLMEGNSELVWCVSKDRLEDDGDLECPEEHLKRNTCILYTDKGKKYCPHYIDCDSASDKPWVYVPLK